MGRDAAKACENQCFRCRKEAAKHNDKLGSREGAAELLGISVSSLADYELGNTKVIPVDKVVLMADIYNAPELMAWYCSSECLIGKSLEMPSPEIASVERTTMKLLKQLRQGDIEQVKEKLIDITADGMDVVSRYDLMDFPFMVAALRLTATSLESLLDEHGKGIADGIVANTTCITIDASELKRQAKEE